MLQNGYFVSGREGALIAGAKGSSPHNYTKYSFCIIVSHNLDVVNSLMYPKQRRDCFGILLLSQRIDRFHP
jgi:hypothetical protein